MNSKTLVNALILLIVIAILGVVNYIAGLGFFSSLRADLTEKNIYTLSDGTKNLLAAIQPDKPVTIRLYVTRDNRLMPQWAQAYSATVQDLLFEFEKRANGRIKLQRIDPRPNTEEEDRAVADDIQGYTVNENGDKAYFGLAVECLQQKEVIPSMNPNDESNLEYQIARAISKVSKTKRAVIGVMCPMPIAGPAFQFPGMQQQQTPPWVIVQQLRQDYDVREVPMSSTSIDADINVLLVVHPYGISEKAEFAIDQFLLKGGKLIAMVDPNCFVSRAYDRPGQMGMAPTVATSPTSDLPKLLAGWGVSYDKSKIVADMKYRTGGNRGRALPTYITVPDESINNDEPITSSLEVLQFFSPGAFSFVEKKEGITYTTLAESSENSEFIDLATAESAQREGLKSFNPDGRKKSFIVRLSGKFPTAFPNGAPEDKGPLEGAPKLPGEAGGEDQKDAGAPAKKDDKKEEKKEEKPAALKEGDGKGLVFLFADVDMVHEMIALESDGQRVLPIARNSNIPLFLNVVELLTGGSDLINVRSRGVTKRPFTKMQEIQEDVERKYRPLVEKEQKAMQDVVDQITARGVKPDGKGNGVITIDSAELKKLREQQASIQKNIRNYQKEQNQEKDRKEMLITAVNILGIPLLLVAFGVTLAIRRSSLRAAH